MAAVVVVVVEVVAVTVVEVVVMVVVEVEVTVVVVAVLVVNTTKYQKFGGGDSGGGGGNVGGCGCSGGSGSGGGGSGGGGGGVGGDEVAEVVVVVGVVELVAVMVVVMEMKMVAMGQIFGQKAAFGNTIRFRLLAVIDFLDASDPSIYKALVADLKGVKRVKHFLDDYGLFSGQVINLAEQGLHGANLYDQATTPGFGVANSSLCIPNEIFGGSDNERKGRVELVRSILGSILIHNFSVYLWSAAIIENFYKFSKIPLKFGGDDNGGGGSGGGGSGRGGGCSGGGGGGSGSGGGGSGGGGCGGVGARGGSEGGGGGGGKVSATVVLSSMTLSATEVDNNEGLCSSFFSVIAGPFFPEICNVYQKFTGRLL
ncbi:mesenchyme-specific cell surface glycoprotein-like [Telopea speciosissima]|uniref:mesenchyme-specific cell surface glycoprotein-like n=1 Tax=Telopea speciosissima TaxID=54955 RepID=UPI001CC4D806|nr:mesenchyme-specific cell surface glycoprotein-like [Telopea speciosissima]